MIVKPCHEICGEYQIPGDKSVTHRAILFNGAAEGEATVTNALLGEDCLSSAACMRALGADVRVDGDVVRVRGVGRFRDAECDCGNSGTTMRLLTGLVAGRGINVRLFGDPSLSSRPMERVAAPLRLLGAKVRTTQGRAPVFVEPSSLVGCAVDTQVASAQVKSALLLAALGAEGETTVREPLRTRDHTERMLAAMGADIRVCGNEITVRGGSLRARDVEVPADISGAAYFMALGALCGETVCRNVGVNPTRTGILAAFDRMGADYSLENEREVCGEPVADIRVRKSPLRAIRLSQEDMPALIDEIPVIAVLLAFAEGESVITGAEELKVKESDRIRTTAEMLCALGGDCTPTADGLIIRGKRTLRGGDVRTYKDHRIAMSGAVGLLASEKGGSIDDPACADISFPGFFDRLGLKI